MDIGIVTRSFPEMDNAQAAAFMADTGFTATELCLVQSDSRYWVYNGTSDLSDLTGRRVRGIADTYRRSGISVCALGVFTNLVEEDPEVLRANLDYFRRHLEFAEEAGIPVVSTECGFDPTARGIRADRYEAVYARLVDSLRRLCEEAERRDVRIALEPCVLDIVPSARRMADTLRKVGSARLQVLLDPANLIANSSERDMFAYLAPRVAYFHGKDRKVDDAYGRPLGEGDIDWALFLHLYHRHCEGIPFILEYANAGNCAGILARVREYDRMAASMEGATT